MRSSSQLFAAVLAAPALANVELGGCYESSSNSVRCALNSSYCEDDGTTWLTPNQVHIEEDGLAICERVKHHFDKTWSPYWHVIIGNNFGSFCTHEMRGYIYFYYGSFVRLPPRGLSLSLARGARSALPNLTRPSRRRTGGHDVQSRVRNSGSERLDRSGRCASIAEVPPYSSTL